MSGEEKRTEIMKKSLFHRFRNSFRKKFKTKYKKRKEETSNTNVKDEKTSYVYNLSVNIAGDNNEVHIILRDSSDTLGTEPLKSSVCKPDLTRTRNNASMHTENNIVQMEKFAELESKSLVQPFTLDDEHKRRLSVYRHYPKSEMKESKESQYGKDFYGHAEHSNLGLSTFETGRSGLTVPSDPIQELDAPLHMDVSDTARKQVATAMKVQKPTESITLPLPVQTDYIPEPVPAHEETQVKQMAEESSNIEINPASSLYSVSSGYPIRSTSSEAEITLTELSLTSCEAIREPKLCKSIQFRSNDKCKEKMVFDDMQCCLISEKPVLEHAVKKDVSILSPDIVLSSRCSMNTMSKEEEDQEHSDSVVEGIVQTCSVVEDPVCKTLSGAIPESKIIFGATQIDGIKCKGDTEVVDHIILGTTYTDEMTLDSENIEKPINDDENRENTGQLRDDFIDETSNFAEHDEETEETKDQYSEKSVTIESKKKQNQVPYVGLEDEILIQPNFILESNHNIEKKTSLIKYVHDSSPSIENEKQVQYHLALSQNVGESVTKVKLRKNEKRLRNYFCKYCHRSRNKPNPKCSFNYQHETSSSSMGMTARPTEVENADIRREIGSIGSTSTDRSSERDSGVFSQFASGVSSYTTSYDSLKRRLKARKESKQEHRKTNSRSGKCKPVDTEEKLRTWEKQLRDTLRRITSSWSYFTPARFNPCLYPGLQSYFERLQSGEQLSLQERYSYEWIRLQSFDQYAGNGSGIVLARNGFYHDSENGTTATRCYACDATYSEWEFFDEVETRHNPGCPHVLGGESGNIPIQPDGDHDLQVSARRSDHSSSDGDSREVTSERDTGNEDEATPVRVTEATGTSSNPPSGGMMSNSMQQASISTQDRDNEQYMSSYVAHRDNGAHLAVASQDEQYTSSLVATRDDHQAVASQDTHTSSPAAQPDQHSHSQRIHHDYRRSMGMDVLSEEDKILNSIQAIRHIIAQPIPPDPLRSTAAADLSEMGFSQDRIEYAILAVLQQTGNTDVTTEQALIWILVDDERRGVIAARRAAGSSAFFGSSQASSTSATTSTSSATASSSSSSSSQSSTGTQQPAETGLRQHSTAGNQRSTETGVKQSASAGSQPPTASDSQQSGGAGGQSSSGTGSQSSSCRRSEMPSLDVDGNQQGAIGETQRTPPDPLRSTAAAVLSKMGYSQDRIQDVLLAVRQQTGSTEVTTEQALIWILDDDERRSAIAARRAAGSSAFFSSSQTSSTSATSSTTSATATASSSSSSSSSSSQSSAGTKQPAETGIKRPASAGSQLSTVSTSQQSRGAGNQGSGGAGSQSSSGREMSSLEAVGNQQGATGGAEVETKRGESSQSSGGKSRRKRKNKKVVQSASLPAEWGTGHSGNSPPNTAEGAAKNSGALPKNKDTQSLRAENEKLRAIQTCKICLDKPVDTTFLPCGHLVCCGRCANKMRKCPICHKPISGSVKTYML